MPNATKRVAYEEMLPEVVQALGTVSEQLTKQGFNKHLIHLIEMRASQINQCAFCVKMHSREARDDGESNDRLDRLIVWRHVSDFSVAEKAALEWTEALTCLKEGTDYGVLRAELREHFSEKDITVLTAAIAMINLWNRVQISNH